MLQGRSGSLGQAFDYRLSLVVPSENLVGSVQIARIRAPPGCQGCRWAISEGDIRSSFEPAGPRVVKGWGTHTRWRSRPARSLSRRTGLLVGQQEISGGWRVIAGAEAFCPVRSYISLRHCAGERSTRPPCPCVTPCPTTLGRSSPALRIVQSMRANHPAAIVGTASGRPFHMYIVLAPPLTRRHRRQWPQ